MNHSLDVGGSHHADVKRGAQGKKDDTQTPHTYTHSIIDNSSAPVRRLFSRHSDDTSAIADDDDVKRVGSHIVHNTRSRSRGGTGGHGSSSSSSSGRPRSPQGTSTQDQDQGQVSPWLHRGDSSKKSNRQIADPARYSAGADESGEYDATNWRSRWDNQENDASVHTPFGSSGMPAARAPSMPSTFPQGKMDVVGAPFCLSVTMEEGATLLPSVQASLPALQQSFPNVFHVLYAYEALRQDFCAKLQAKEGELVRCIGAGQELMQQLDDVLREQKKWKRARKREVEQKKSRKKPQVNEDEETETLETKPDENHRNDAQNREMLVEQQDSVDGSRHHDHSTASPTSTVAKDVVHRLVARYSELEAEQQQQLEGGANDNTIGGRHRRGGGGHDGSAGHVTTEPIPSPSPPPPLLAVQSLMPIVFEEMHKVWEYIQALHLGFRAAVELIEEEEEAEVKAAARRRRETQRSSHSSTPPRLSSQRRDQRPTLLAQRPAFVPPAPAALPPAPSPSDAGPQSGWSVVSLSTWVFQCVQGLTAYIHPLQQVLPHEIEPHWRRVHHKYREVLQRCRLMEDTLREEERERHKATLRVQAMTEERDAALEALRQLLDRMKATLPSGAALVRGTSTLEAEEAEIDAERSIYRLQQQTLQVSIRAAEVAWAEQQEKMAAVHQLAEHHLRQRLEAREAELRLAAQVAKEAEEREHSKAHRLQLLEQECTEGEAERQLLRHKLRECETQRVAERARWEKKHQEVVQLMENFLRHPVSGGGADWVVSPFNGNAGSDGEMVLEPATVSHGHRSRANSVATSSSSSSPSAVGDNSGPVAAGPADRLRGIFPSPASIPTEPVVTGMVVRGGYRATAAERLHEQLTGICQATETHNHRLEEELYALKKKLARVSEELEQAESRLQSREADETTDRHLVEGLRDEVQAWKNKAKSLEQRHADAAGRLSSCVVQRDQLEREREEHVARLASLGRELEKHKKAAEQNAATDGIRLQHAREEVERLKETIQKQRDEHTRREDQHTRKLQGAAHELSTAKQTIQRLEKELRGGERERRMQAQREEEHAALCRTLDRRIYQLEEALRHAGKERQQLIDTAQEWERLLVEQQQKTERLLEEAAREQQAHAAALQKAQLDVAASQGEVARLTRSLEEIHRRSRSSSRSEHALSSMEPPAARMEEESQHCQRPPPNEGAPPNNSALSPAEQPSPEGETECSSDQPTSAAPGIVAAEVTHPDSREEELRQALRAARQRLREKDQESIELRIALRSLQGELGTVKTALLVSEEKAAQAEEDAQYCREKLLRVRYPAKHEDEGTAMTGLLELAADAPPPPPLTANTSNTILSTRENTTITTTIIHGSVVPESVAREQHAVAVEALLTALHRVHQRPFQRLLDALSALSGSSSSPPPESTLDSSSSTSMPSDRRGKDEEQDFGVEMSVRQAGQCSAPRIKTKQNPNFSASAAARADHVLREMQSHVVQEALLLVASAAALTREHWDCFLETWLLACRKSNEEQQKTARVVSRGTDTDTSAALLLFSGTDLVPLCFEAEGNSHSATRGPPAAVREGSAAPSHTATTGKSSTDNNKVDGDGDDNRADHVLVSSPQPPEVIHSRAVTSAFTPACEPEEVVVEGLATTTADAVRRLHEQRAHLHRQLLTDLPSFSPRDPHYGGRRMNHNDEEEEEEVNVRVEEEAYEVVEEELSSTNPHGTEAHHSRGDDVLHHPRPNIPPQHSHTQEERDKGTAGANADANATIQQLQHRLEEVQEELRGVYAKLEEREHAASVTEQECLEALHVLQGSAQQLEEDHMLEQQQHDAQRLLAMESNVKDFCKRFSTHALRQQLDSLQRLLLLKREQDVLLRREVAGLRGANEAMARRLHQAERDRSSVRRQLHELLTTPPRDQAAALQAAAALALPPPPPPALQDHNTACREEEMTQKENTLKGKAEETDSSIYLPLPPPPPPPPPPMDQGILTGAGENEHLVLSPPSCVRPMTPCEGEDRNS